MAEVTAALVKDLREKSGAGMMDCKNALVESAGDIEAAIDWLRAKGLSKAAKKSGRVAAEGLVAVSVKGTSGVVIELNSETDFVARNEDFQSLARGIATVALEKGASLESLLVSPYPGSATVQDAVSNAIATIGENMTLRRSAELSVKSGVVNYYVHNAITEGLGKIGVIVALESTGSADELNKLARQIAMHVAASSPIALDSTSVDASVIEREKAVLLEKNAGKPANVLEKITESGLKSYFKEICLVDQPFVMDPSKSVGVAVKDSEKAVGAPVTLTGFVRFALGEGVEKEVTDFAAEVAAAVKPN